MATKACTKCGAVKEIKAENFARAGRYFRPECKPCQYARQRDYRERNRALLDSRAAEYRDANRETLAQKAREYHWNNREIVLARMRAADLARTYGLSREQYDAMLADQGGGCALCGRKPGRRELAVDHDHQTGQVRGLLCSSCNGALGVLGDSREGLLRALAYLDLQVV
jgi:hypothetical protein